MTRLIKILFAVVACTGLLTALFFADDIPDGLPPGDRRLLRVVSVVKHFVAVASHLHSLITFTDPVKSQRYIRERVIAPLLAKGSDSMIDQQVLNLDGVPGRSYVHKSVGKNPLPGIIYLHGGGWAHGSSSFYQPIFSELIRRLDNKVKIISIDYRLVPDFVYPVPLDDCVKAVKVLLELPEKFQLDRNKLIIAGDSAGANLAFGVNLRLRNENFTTTSLAEATPAKIQSQILIYPVSHAINFLTKSFHENENDPILSKEDAIKYVLDYMDEDYTVINEAKVAINRHVGDSLRQTKAWKYAAMYNDPLADHSVTPSKQLIARMSSKLADPYLFPLMSDDLHSNLPKTFILTCEHDVLRDDGFALVKRMQDEAGDQQVVHKHVGCFHGAFNLFDKAVTGKEIMNAVVEWLRGEL